VFGYLLRARKSALWLRGELIGNRGFGSVPATEQIGSFTGQEPRSYEVPGKGKRPANTALGRPPASLLLYWIRWTMMPSHCFRPMAAQFTWAKLSSTWPLVVKLFITNLLHFELALAVSPSVTTLEVPR
jgi:hypothetical protein